MKIINLLTNANKWIKLVIGTSIFIVGTVVVIYFNISDSEIFKKLLILLAVPGVYALMGLIEIITGAPFKETATRWDNLTGWQRGLFGVAIVILSFALMASGIVLFVL